MILVGHHDLLDWLETVKNYRSVLHVLGLELSILWHHLLHVVDIDMVLVLNGGIALVIVEQVNLVSVKYLSLGGHPLVRLIRRRLLHHLLVYNLAKRAFLRHILLLLTLASVDRVQFLKLALGPSTDKRFPDTREPLVSLLEYVAEALFELIFRLFTTLEIAATVVLAAFL